MKQLCTAGPGRIVCQDQSSLDDWRRFLGKNPAASIYHLPEWSRTLEKSFGYRPFHLYAEDGKEGLCGILPLFLVKSPLTGSRLVSLPFSYICGPLSNTIAALEFLLEESKRLYRELKCNYLEIRMADGEAAGDEISIWQKNGFQVSRQFSTFILELAPPEVVWKKLDPKSVRWAINKARRDGVQVKRGGGPEDIRQFYELNLATKRRLGVPGHPQRLFSCMFEEMGDRCRLYLALYRDRVIAGIITLRFHDTVLYAYGASDARFRHHQPNDLLVWTAVEESCREGYKFFDFGRVSTEEKGLSRFKKHWGTEEKRLNYFFYPRIPDSLALNPRGVKYRLTSSLWKKTPLPLARFCSNLVFKHLG